MAWASIGRRALHFYRLSSYFSSHITYKANVKSTEASKQVEIPTYTYNQHLQPILKFVNYPSHINCYHIMPQPH